MNVTAIFSTSEHKWEEVISVTSEDGAKDQIQAILNIFNGNLPPGHLHRTFHGLK